MRIRGHPGYLICFEVYKPLELRVERAHILSTTGGSEGQRFVIV